VPVGTKPLWKKKKEKGKSVLLEMDEGDLHSDSDSGGAQGDWR